VTRPTTLIIGVGIGVVVVAFMGLLVWWADPRNEPSQVELANNLTPVGTAPVSGQAGPNASGYR